MEIILEQKDPSLLDRSTHSGMRSRAESARKSSYDIAIKSPQDYGDILDSGVVHSIVQTYCLRDYKAVGAQLKADLKENS